MKINRENYSAYILDFYEGTLSESDQAELMHFLNLNADCKAEFEEFENISLEAPEVSFSFKKDLKKETQISDEEYFALAEGELDRKSAQELNRIIAGNAERERELRLWKAARVSPDLTVVFGGKHELKKGVRVVFLWSKTFMRAAAVLVLALTAAAMYFLNRDADGVSMASVARSNDKFGYKAEDSNQNKEIQIASSSNASKTNDNTQKNKKRDVVQLVSNVKDTATFIAITPNEKQDSIPLRKEIIEPQESYAAVGSSKAQQTITWEPETEAVSSEEKKPRLKKRLLDFAVTCLNGLKRAGVKKAEAVKTTDPDSGETDYILVLGNRSYTTKAN